MSRTLKDFLEVYKPASKDEQDFVDKHVTIKHKDRNGNGDEVFKAKKVKTVKRSTEHGYDAGADEAVYEALAPHVHSSWTDNRDPGKGGTGYLYHVRLDGSIHGSGNLRHNKKFKSPERACEYLASKGFTKNEFKEDVEQIDEISNELRSKWISATWKKHLAHVDDEGGPNRNKPEMPKARQKVFNKAMNKRDEYYSQKSKEDHAKKILAHTPKVHDLRHMSHGEVYDHTQTSDKIHDGDVMHVKGGVAAMVQAWPVMVHGKSDTLHKFKSGVSLHTTDNGIYKKTAQLADKTHGIKEDWEQGEIDQLLGEAFEMIEEGLSEEELDEAADIAAQLMEEFEDLEEADAYAIAVASVTGVDLEEDAEEITEISRDTKKKYIRAAHQDVNKRLGKIDKTDKEYDKIYDRERHMEKAAASVKGHLNDYKMKPVQGLYDYAHFEHPDGSFAQTRRDGKGEWIHQDKNGKRSTHKNTEALIAHVNKIHEEVENLDELSNDTMKDYLKKSYKSTFSSMTKGGQRPAERRIKGMHNAEDKLMKRNPNAPHPLHTLNKESVELEEEYKYNSLVYCGPGGVFNSDKGKHKLISNHTTYRGAQEARAKHSKANGNPEDHYLIHGSNQKIYEAASVIEEGVGVHCKSFAEFKSAAQEMADHITGDGKVHFHTKEVTAGGKTWHQTSSNIHNMRNGGFYSYGHFNHSGKGASEEGHGRHVTPHELEESVQIDELSKEKIGQYVNAAHKDVTLDAARSGSMHRAKKDTKLLQRSKGISTAIKKLTKEDIINRAIERFLPEDYEIPSLEERLLKKLDGLSENNTAALVGLFRSLNSTNQEVMYEECDTLDGINKLLDLTIQARGSK